MSTYTAEISWSRQDHEPFTDNKYSRAHRWIFDGGVTIPASSSPEVVPLPYSDTEAVDPEEAFLASLSSCHMLWFLSLAARSGFIADSYRDHAEARMDKDSQNELYMKTVRLRPEVIYSGDNQPSPEEEQILHQKAHKKCFIANSVRSQIDINPVRTDKKIG